MIKRKFAKLVGQRLKSYPAVALVGPRQSGKTTLAKSLGGFYSLFDIGYSLFDACPERSRRI